MMTTEVLEKYKNRETVKKVLSSKIDEYKKELKKLALMDNRYVETRNRVIAISETLVALRGVSKELGIENVG